jgi:transposase-like protein
MKGHGAKLPHKQEEAILALLTQRSVEEAAKSVGVAPKTLFRWMRVAEFEAAYRKAKRCAFGQSMGRMQQASSAAVSTLLKVMVDPNSPAACRVRAADSVLHHAAKAIEIEDVEARLSALEKAAEDPHQEGYRN